MDVYCTWLREFSYNVPPEYFPTSREERRRKKDLSRELSSFCVDCYRYKNRVDIRGILQWNESYYLPYQILASDVQWE